MVQVVDNFLSERDLTKLTDVIFSENFLWGWIDSVAYGENDPNFEKRKENLIYLCHTLYKNPIMVSPVYEFISDIFNNMNKNMKVKSLLRIKVNCYPQSHKLEEHGIHQDYKYSHKGALLSLNTCDGYTRFETGEKVESVKNRMIYFDPYIKHTSTNTTNAVRRVNINFNYF